MAAFGFSVGDFLAGLQLVYAVSASLEASTGSRAKFQLLISEFENLGATLQAIATLPCPLGQESRLSVIQNAVTKCNEDIAAFVQKKKRYKKAFDAKSSEKWWVGTLEKISWELYGEDDVSRFKDVIHSHAIRIQLRVTAFKMYLTLQSIISAMLM
jgi:hypothetical protein